MLDCLRVDDLRVEAGLDDPNDPAFKRSQEEILLTLRYARTLLVRSSAKPSPAIRTPLRVRTADRSLRR